MKTIVQPKKGVSREAALIAFLALVCAGIFLTCVFNSLQWIGKPFPGFLLMDNRVVPAAGLPQWTGLQAGKIFMCELVAVDGHPVQSSQWLREYIASMTPGKALQYTFHRGDETLELSIPVMLFTGKDFLLLFVFYFMNGFAFIVVGFVVRIIRPGNPASLGMFLLGLCAGLFATTGCDLYGPHWFFRLHVLMECCMPAAIVHLALVFPEMSRRVRERPALLALPYLAALVLAAYYEIFLYHPGRYVLSHNLATYAFGFAMAFMLVMITLRYIQTANMLTKQRIRVLFLGYFTGLAIPALIVVAGAYLQQDFSFTLIAFFTILWPVSVGYAILKHNFFDIDVVVKRSLYYVSLTSTILATYLGVLFVLDKFFHGYAFSQSRYFPLLFCMVILLLFNPLRLRMQRIIDRVFFRIRYDYRETVEAVSKAMTSLLNVREIADTLLETLTDTMTVSRGIVALQGVQEDGPLIYSAGDPADTGPEHEDREAGVKLFQGLREDPALLTVYDFEGSEGRQNPRVRLLPLMSTLGILLAVPVTFKSRMIGFLGLGGKKSGKPFSRSDLDLLETLANQSSVALSNALSYSELQDLNQNLEGLVEKRTSELAESNHKLEASNEKLKELDKLKSQFFSNVGHELRTPLTLSLAPLESILQGETGDLDPDRRTLLSTIHRSSLKLLKLVNNLLDFSKIEAGRLRLNLGSLPFVPFLQEVVEPFQLAAPNRGISITVNESGVRDEALSMTVDRERMEKVFANLLSNAFKYTPAGGSIEVAVSELEQEVRVSVSDTGPGIPEEDLPRIFERFYQAKAKDAKRLPGTGIGLSLVKEFSELHGGSVTVESTVGQGTRFTVTLQKGRDHFPEDLLQEAEASRRDDGIVADTGTSSHALYLDVEPGEAEEAPAADTAPADAPCILVVEDNPEMRGFIRVLLQKRYRVAEAADGQEGLEVCREQRPDLILSDVTMPRMSGIELCRAVKQDNDLKFIPFVLLTSHAEVQFRIEGFESGADDYLGKPFNVRELQARIHSLLTLRMAEKELKQAHDELTQAHGELQQAESQLVHSEKMASMGRLVAGVAHELNNPISFVYGNMNILQEYIDSIRGVLEAYRGLQLEQAAQEDLEQRWQDSDMDFILEDMGGLIEGCREGALRTKQIVKDLRTFSRLDESERKSIDIHHNLRSTLTLLSKQFGDRIRVHEEFQDLPEVECYAGQINQVFMNLLANAGQAMEEGGDIWVRTRFLEPDRVEIQIEDNGCGMSPETLDKIFDPFFTTKPVGSGTGLGLSISYGIVQRHAGSITVKSEPGKGTCFTLQLPKTLPSEYEEDADVQTAA